MSADKAIVSLEPFAVSPKETAQIENCSVTSIYERLHEYETYLDGASRKITLRSIRARQQRKLAEAKDIKRPAGPRRPRKTKT